MTDATPPSSPEPNPRPNPEPPLPPEGSPPEGSPQFPRLPKWLAIAGVTIAIAAAGTAGVATYFVKTKLSPLVARSLTTLFDRPVKIGAVNGFGLTSVSFDASQLPATEGDRSFAQIPAVTANFNPLQAIGGELDLTVTLEEPTVTLIQAESGQWLDIKLKPAESESRLKIQLDTLEIAGGKVSLVPFQPSKPVLPPHPTPTPAPAPTPPAGSTPSQNSGQNPRSNLDSGLDSGLDSETGQSPRLNPQRQPNQFQPNQPADPSLVEPAPSRSQPEESQPEGLQSEGQPEGSEQTQIAPSAIAIVSDHPVQSLQGNDSADQKPASRPVLASPVLASPVLASPVLASRESATAKTVGRHVSGKPSDRNYAQAPNTPNTPNSSESTESNPLEFLEPDLNFNPGINPENSSPARPDTNRANPEQLNPAELLQIPGLSLPDAEPSDLTPSDADSAPANSEPANSSPSPSPEPTASPSLDPVETSPSNTATPDTTQPDVEVITAPNAIELPALEALPDPPTSLRLFDVDGKVRIEAEGQRVAFEAIGKNGKFGRLDVKGEMQTPTGAILLDVAAQNVAGEALTTALPLPFDLHGGRLFSNLNIALDANNLGAIPVISGTARGTDVLVELGGAPQPIFIEKTNVGFQERKIAFENAIGQYGPLPVSIERGLIDLERGYELPILVPPVDWRVAQRAVMPDFALDGSGEVVAQLILRGALEQPILVGQMKNLSPIEIDRLALSDLNGQFGFSIATGEFILEQLNATPASGGQVQAAMKLQLPPDEATPMQVLTEFALVDINVDAIAFDYGGSLPIDRVSARGQVTLQNETIGIAIPQIQIGDGLGQILGQIRGNQWQGEIAVNNLPIDPALTPTVNLGRFSGRAQVAGLLDVFSAPDLNKIALQGIGATTVNGQPIEFGAQLGNGQWRVESQLNNVPITAFTTLPEPISRFDIGGLSGTVVAAGITSGLELIPIQMGGSGQIPVEGGVINGNVTLNGDRWESQLALNNVGLAKLARPDPLARLEVGGLSGTVVATGIQSGSQFIPTQINGSGQIPVEGGAIAGNVALNGDQWNSQLAVSHVGLAKLLPANLPLRSPRLSSPQLNLAGTTAFDLATIAAQGGFELAAENGGMQGTLAVRDAAWLVELAQFALPVPDPWRDLVPVAINTATPSQLTGSIFDFSPSAIAGRILAALPTTDRDADGNPTGGLGLDLRLDREQWQAGVMIPPQELTNLLSNQAIAAFTQGQATPDIAGQIAANLAVTGGWNGAIPAGIRLENSGIQLENLALNGEILSDRLVGQITPGALSEQQGAAAFPLLASRYGDLPNFSAVEVADDLSIVLIDPDRLPGNANPNSVTTPDANPEPNPETSPEPNPDLNDSNQSLKQSETDEQTGTQSEAQPKPQAENQVDPEPNPEPSPETNSELNPETNPETNPEPSSEPNPETDPDADSDTNDIDISPDLFNLEIPTNPFLEPFLDHITPSDTEPNTNSNNTDNSNDDTLTPDNPDLQPPSPTSNPTPNPTPTPSASSTNPPNPNDVDRIIVQLSPDFLPRLFEVQLGDFKAAGRCLGEWRTSRDRCDLMVERFPIDWLGLQPVPDRGRITGDLGFDGQVNPLDRSLRGELNWLDPQWGGAAADAIIGTVAWRDRQVGVDGLTVIRDETRYEFNGTVNLLDDPQLGLKVSVANGDLQDLLELLQWSEIEDISRGFVPPELGTATDLSAVAVGDPARSILNSIRRLVEIDLLREQREQRTIGRAVLPDLRDLDGQFSAELDLNGTVSNPQIDFAVLGTDWQWSPYTMPELQLVGRYRDQQLEFDPSWLTASVEPNTLTRLDLNGILSPDLQSANLELTGLPLSFVGEVAKLPDQFRTAGVLDAVATLAGTQTDPRLRGTLHLADGRLNGKAIELEQGGFFYENGRIDFGGNLITLGFRAIDSSPNASDSNTADREPEPNRNTAVTVRGTSPFALPGATTLDPDDRFSVTLDTRDDGMAFLNALTDSVGWLGGRGEANITLNGRRRNGIYQVEQTLGTATFDGAILRSPQLPEPLTDVRGTINLNGDRITVTDLIGKFQQGAVKATGNLSLFDPFASDSQISVVLDQVALNLKRIYSGGIDGRIEITGSALLPNIGGYLTLTDGLVFLPDPDAPAPVAAPIGSTPIIRYDNLKIRLEDNIRLVSPPTLDFVADGLLTVRGLLDNPFPAGKIFLRDGRVNLFTTAFTLEQNRFNTAIFDPQYGRDPILDVKMGAALTQTTRNRIVNNVDASDVTRSRELQDVALERGGVETIRITATVQGRASQLFDRLDLSSTPARPELELYALMGGGVSETTEGGGTVAIASSALLTQLQSIVNRALGLRDFRLFPAFDPRTSSLGLGAEVGVRLTDRLSSSFQVILDRDNSIRFGTRYRINDDLILRGSTDFSDDNRGSIEFQTRF